MNKPLISYHLDSCEHCLKCIRACPTEAICRYEQGLEIDENKCIHCGQCIEVCEKNGLKVDNAHISTTLKNYDYTVALVPGSFFADFTSEKEAGKMLKAIKNLGFDEVLDYSDVEGAIYLETIQMAENSDELKIASFCPCINALIQKHFPMLLDHLVPLEYPVEAAAKMVRERLEGQYEKVGIYSLCDCVSKKMLAKDPFGNPDSAIDHAMSLSHIFPKANRAKDDEALELHLCKAGISSVVSDFYHYYQGMRPLISVSGVSHCMKALELAEFGHLDEIGLLGLFACSGGCIGGRYLWSNPLCGRIHMDKISALTDRPVAKLDKSWIEKSFEMNEKQTNFKEKMQRFKRINAILSTLPQFDCGACGYPNCRALAEAIDNGKTTDAACRVKKEGGAGD